MSNTETTSRRSEARLVDGKIVPGAWIVPGLGKSRFTRRSSAEKTAATIEMAYPGCWQAKVEEEPSRSRPGESSYQVYIRSLGAMEGLVKS